MASTCRPIRPRVIRSASFVELTCRSAARVGAPASFRLPSKVTQIAASTRQEDGPSCIFVGPIETASKETLEALYRQARDAYYSGQPLIVDDMFDRIELKLRWYGSKSVVKYPRCSLRRQATYADAEEDLSQVFALASIWILIFALGSSACFVPAIYILSQAYGDSFHFGSLYSSEASSLPFIARLNGIMFIALGLAIGYPVASAAVKVLRGLWRNDLAALKGACPNCGEEVFAFVRSDQSNSSAHRADCHVCDCSLEFRTKVEKSISRAGRKWIYGRIYLVSRGGRKQSKQWM